LRLSFATVAPWTRLWRRFQQLMMLRRVAALIVLGGFPMVKQPAYLAAFKAYTRTQHGTEDDVEKVVKDLGVESDRSVVIIAATGVEDILEWAIRTKMPTLQVDPAAGKYLFGANGPCSTFATKILVAYALGVIDRATKDQCDLIREIRNGCAHGRKPLSFERPELTAICKAVIGKEFLSELPDHKPRTIRDAFVVATAAIQHSVIAGRRLTAKEAYRATAKRTLGKT
jgi:hypothetical protein